MKTLKIGYYTKRFTTNTVFIDENQNGYLVSPYTKTITNERVLFLPSYLANDKVFKFSTENPYK